ncbi:MAG: hypothetical protein GY910_05695 [bacterium]|nr:hypothetical protein [bacterium]
MKILRLTTLLLLSTMVASVATAQTTATFNLRASASTLTTSDGEVIPMWGFSDSGLAAPTTWEPGPELVVPPGTTTLEIVLTNDLPEAVSLFIPGQTPVVDTGTGEGQPVYSTMGSGVNRVQSFTHEAAPGGTATYTWENVREGSFLYQSGTNPAKHVQMGLFGALAHNFAQTPPGPGSALTDNEVYEGRNFHESHTLIFSEIDPVMHIAIAAGDYGTGGTITSAIDYTPQYYLLNGKEFDPGSDSPIPVGLSGRDLLLRFLNAGYQTYVPVLQDLYMTIVAEDGNEYPYPRVQYSIELPAGKTHDALVKLPCPEVPAVANDPWQGRIVTIQDRRGNIRNPGSGSDPGGMTVQFEVNADGACDNCALLVNNDQFDVDADGFGNLCDADLNANLMVNFQDLSMFITAFVSQSNPAADFNSDGIINFGDVGVIAVGFGKPPGPSLAVP